MTTSTVSYTCDVDIAYQQQNCGTASPTYRHNSSKKGFVGLVMLQDVQKVKWSSTYLRGVGELEAN